MRRNAMAADEEEMVIAGFWLLGAPEVGKRLCVQEIRIQNCYLPVVLKKLHEKMPTKCLAQGLTLGNV